MNIDKAVDALKLALNQAIKGKGQSKAPAKKKNERGEDDDRRQIMADLISREESPFLPDDEESLRSMTEETLKKMRDAYITRAEGDEEEAEPAVAEETDEEEPVENDGDEIDEEETAPVAKKKGKVMTRTATKKPVLATFSNEDKAALLHARTLLDARKSELVEKITGNSAITKDQANAMDLATLEVVAAGIRPEANYSGRAMPVNAEEATDAGKAMVAPSVSDMIVNRNKKGA